MSTLKGLASIAKGLSAEPSAELVKELAASSETAPEARFLTRTAPGSTRPLAKTRDQQYKRVMILIKKATEKTAYRRWEDTHPDKDFSDLVEDLLSRYADGQISV